MHNKSKKLSILSKDGFTLLETLIALAIMTSIAGIGLVVGIDSYQRTQLRQEHASVASLLEKARSESMNNVGAVSHGVRISNGQAVLFRGNSFITRDPQWDMPIGLSNAVEVHGPDEIVFARGSGEVKQGGTVSLSDGHQSFPITINNEGGIHW